MVGKLEQQEADGVGSRLKACRAHAGTATHTAPCQSDQHIVQSATGGSAYDLTAWGLLRRHLSCKSEAMWPTRSKKEGDVGRQVAVIHGGTCKGWQGMSPTLCTLHHGRQQAAAWQELRLRLPSSNHPSAEGNSLPNTAL